MIAGETTERTQGKTNLPRKAPKVTRPMPEAQSQSRDGEKEEERA